MVIYQTTDSLVKLEVRLENETMWLTQAAMAELFQTTQQNISLHIQNIYDEGELNLSATHKEYLLVRREGNRDVQRPIGHYNLDAIISVGYRVKSIIATRFTSRGERHLFDLATDPDENDNLASSDAARLSLMEGKLDAAFAGSAPMMTPAP